MSSDSTSTTSPTSSAHPSGLDKPDQNQNQNNQPKKQSSPQPSPALVPTSSSKEAAETSSSDDTTPVTETRPRESTPPANLVSAPSTSPTAAKQPLTTITPPSTTTAAVPSTTASTTPSVSATAPSPSPRGRARCAFKTCTRPPQRIVGDCSFCSGHFCNRHRMLEDHKCTGLEDCKEQARSRNRDRLEGERTAVVRGV